MPRYPLLSAGLIGRLVVDRRYQGHGWGGLMVVDAAARAIRADPAFYALIVDAEDDHAAAFYARLGFQCFTGHERRLFIPLSEIVKRL
ncbi:GNAT family N-acetyltransferase [Thiorhodococcus mannitoliphagus]|uniref:GNAT family N-acetyltransferase n=1 Tax=Thiorhodococcus mannitoliphagus TaxID=329406 RepID=A0A6P1DYS1_9GAMM|nr:GNAT family N-acetyltransferase [Thiorhodococcus mannitoliphagus]NEX21866.1 GNAT family N-acetyltransferase [Thiorhodococcus mannitoliphagus]